MKVDVAKDAKERVLGANGPMKNEDDLLKVRTVLFGRLQP